MKIDINKIIAQILKIYVPFTGTQYPMPVCQAILGKLPDIDKLKQDLSEIDASNTKALIEPLAISAEILESIASDRDEYFLNDSRVRNLVFMGSKWRAGWVVAAGDGVDDNLIKKLNSRGYYVFTNHQFEDTDGVISMPNRETWPIYFLQLMVRYAMIWGQIPAGQDHEMGHFLERDMPGAMLIKGSVKPLESILLLELMNMGCPSVVGEDFQFDFGPRVVAKNDEEIIKAIGEFPNMRVRYVDGETLALPEYANSNNSSQKFETEISITGYLNFKKGTNKPGIHIIGDREFKFIFVDIQIDDEMLDLPLTAYFETQVVKFGSYIDGIRTYKNNQGIYTIEVAKDKQFEPQMLGQTIYNALKQALPKLKSLSVNINLLPELTDEIKSEVEMYRKERDKSILEESEDNEDYVVACIDCQPFSHIHVCVLTPDRPPMCGRNRYQIKANAIWGADYRPWTRRNIANEALQYIVHKEETIDETAGEWSGVNKALHKLSGGKLDRVRIHSISEYPHTSCGCFGALAFIIPGTNHIGIMERDYKGIAPGGLTWDKLANQAGGKQSKGVSGITPAYLKSPKALAGDGGLANVKWVTKKIYAVIESIIPEKSDIIVAD